MFDPWVWKIPWRRNWQSTPVFLPGKSHEQRSLVGYSPRAHKRVRYDLMTKQQWLYCNWQVKLYTSSQGYGFSSGHVWMWELDYEESWVLKNWSFWTVVLEKTLENPLDCKEIQPVHPRGDQSWVFIGRTDAEAETPILWPPHARSWLIGKDPDAGRGWEQEEKGTTEDVMSGCHPQLDGHELE